MANIVNNLRRREIQARGQECKWDAYKLLEELLCHETYFEHHYLGLLHVIIKDLCARTPDVCYAVINKSLEWEKKIKDDNYYENVVIRSHVFLVRHIAEYLSKTELNRLQDIVEEIKMNTN
jgi:hypothetical protein